MTPRTSFIKWAIIGGIIAVVFVVGQASSVGGLGGLLQVGESSSLRPMIEAELGEIPLAPGPGHDGQIYYAIGLDLSGNEVPQLLDHGAYRYRRIFYPLLSSAAGLLGGYALLYGMIVTVVIATASATGLLASVAVARGRSEWVALAVILNPGLWLSMRLLTADVVALALMIAALAAVGTRRAVGNGLFALSTLSKDVFLTSPAGLVLDRGRKWIATLLVPLIVLIVWMTWLTFWMGEGFTGRGNLALPFQGLLQAAPNWASLDAEEWFYLFFALVSVGGGLVMSVIRRGWLRWSLLGWSALGLVASNWVWDFGNNAARAFAPITVLIALDYLDPTEAGSAEDAERGMGVAT